MDSASSQNTESLIQMSLLYYVSKIKNSVKIVWRKRLDVQSRVQCARVQLRIYSTY